MSEAIVFRMDSADVTRKLVIGGDRKVLYRVRNIGAGKLVINDSIDLPWNQTVDVWVSELRVKSVTDQGNSGPFLGSYEFLSP